MPMMREQKTEAVKNIKQLFANANGYFITDYQGLNVLDITALRKDLRENKVKFLVAKNSLFKLAAADAGIDFLDEHFVGPTAIAFANEDSAVAAKILYDSYKDKELPRIKVFVVENQVYGADEIKRLADLPSRDVLLSMLVSAVESPLTELVGSLDAFFRDLVGSIDALVEKKKAEGTDA